MDLAHHRIWLHCHNCYKPQDMFASGRDFAKDNDIRVVSLTLFKAMVFSATDPLTCHLYLLIPNDIDALST